KRMTIEVQPEKGVTAMSWAPCQPGGWNYNVDNWNDIYLAGSNLWSWQNHGILYTIMPYAGNEWITGGSKESWNVALGIPELNYIQQSGQLAATTTTPPTWASGVKPGEQFSLKLPVYLNSDSTEAGNLVKVSVFWGQNAQDGMAKTTYFDIVKNAADLPSPLPFTGGSGITTLIISSLALLGASLAGVLIYRKRKNA
ncbi:MAG: LPXTG cell wall anchor domain-containing protein, partial [Aeriscardovia sp.]|nr:LPXTG cell wall anchor domain-containing protein [Aeriscardovia sp.]